MGPAGAAPGGASMAFGSDSNLYMATNPSGPGTPAGPQDPVTTTGYWNALVKYSDWQTLVPDKAWKLPNGFILQVTAYPTFNSGSNTTVTLPVTLPNRIIFASATIASSNSIAIAAYPVTAQLSLSQIRVGAWASAATNLNGYLIVIGN